MSDDRETKQTVSGRAGVWLLRIAILALVGAALYEGRFSTQSPEPVSPADPRAIDLVILNTSILPDPLTAPYAHCVTYLQARVEQVGESIADGGPAEGETVLLLAWAFKNREQQPASSVRTGDRLSLHLMPYADVSSRYESEMYVDDTNDYSSARFWSDFGLPDDRPLTDSSVSHAPVTDTASKVADTELNDVATLRPIDFRVERMRAELTGMGGWNQWYENLAPFRRDLDRLLQDNRPSRPDRDGFVTSDHYLFSTNRLQYLLTQESVEGVWSALASVVQLGDDLNRKGIHLIVMPIPPRSVVYPDKYSNAIPPGRPSPLDLRFMLGLADVGIEVIDLYPVFKRARRAGIEPLYRYNDPHWDTKGIRIAAKSIRAALAEHGIVGDESYTLRDILLEKPGGSIQTALPADKRDRYTSPSVRVQQVRTPKGDKFQAVPDSPVVLAGDSYLNMYARPGANLTAHLSRELGLGVSVLSSAGGGPKVSAMLSRQPDNYLDGRRVLILCFVTRYLDARYAGEWRVVPLN